MNNTKRTLAFAAVGAGILLGAAAAPAGAAETPVPSLGAVTGAVPGADWTWRWASNVQSQNGLANIATGGNLCTGLVGVLAPANSCGSA